MIVVIDGDQITKLKMTCCAGSLTRNAFHSAPIAKEHESVVVYKVKARFVEDSSSVCLCNRKTDGIGKALSKWTGGNLDTRSIMRFWMTGCDAVYRLHER